MAKIIQTSTKRRMVKMTTDDVIAVVSQYQAVTCGQRCYDVIRNILDKNEFYLAEDI